MSGFVVLLFACFAVLSEIGVDVAPLLAGAGVVGVALGFGSQSLVKDFLSGMFILVEDQFGVGDIVDLDGRTVGHGRGRVAAHDAAARRRRDRLARAQRRDHPRRQQEPALVAALLDVEVADDTDIDQAKDVIKRVADALGDERDDILEEPEVWGVERRDDGRS